MRADDVKAAHTDTHTGALVYVRRCVGKPARGAASVDTWPDRRGRVWGQGITGRMGVRVGVRVGSGRREQCRRARRVRKRVMQVGGARDRQRVHKWGG